MTTHIERLIQQLDDSTGPSYDARAELIDIGPEAVPTLSDGPPSLGARPPVVPPLTARLRPTAADNAPGRPSAHFTEIINDLTDHAQVILYSQFWRVDACDTYGVSGPALNWELDWTAPWEHLVEESRTWSLLEASEAPVGDDVFVAPTWIDRTDLHPER
ncbi:MULTISPECIES: hypothetical protein [unclassified Streptomyces]|uniref:hypothetical protein n=1 Tax=unclassified Streptomyces TaxID=2593676 RepID=UPI0035D95412